MAFEILRMVLEMKPDAISATERSVLMVLAWHAQQDGGNAFPAVPTIALGTPLGK